jgi:hypothetical protein
MDDWQQEAMQSNYYNISKPSTYNENQVASLYRHKFSSPSI